VDGGLRVREQEVLKDGKRLMREGVKVGREDSVARGGERERWRLRWAGGEGGRKGVGAEGDPCQLSWREGRKERRERRWKGRRVIRAIVGKVEKRGGEGRGRRRRAKNRANREEGEGP